MHRFATFRRCLIAILLLFGLPSHAETQEQEAETTTPTTNVLGWVEYVRIEPWGLKMRTRLDTGAKTASLSGRDIEYFEKDDQQWVRFICDYKHDTGKPERSVTLERPLVRMVRIKRHNRKIQERPVVALNVCFGNTIRKIEFSLIDRRGLNYPMLLGREALQNFTLVDPSRSFLNSPDCGHRKSKKPKNPPPAPQAE